MKMTMIVTYAAIRHPRAQVKKRKGKNKSRTVFNLRLEVPFLTASQTIRS
jgi:hypothetical protein